MYGLKKLMSSKIFLFLFLLYGFQYSVVSGNNDPDIQTNVTDDGLYQDFQENFIIQGFRGKSKLPGHIRKKLFVSSTHNFEITQSLALGTLRLIARKMLHKLTSMWQKKINIPHYSDSLCRFCVARYHLQSLGLTCT